METIETKRKFGKLCPWAGRMANSCLLYTSIMTGGGPFKKTYMYGMYIYDSGFSFGRFGYAASLAWIMFLIILFISMFILKSLEKRMNYED